MMKATVQCECGSAFSAPASLIGQVVKCPVCGAALKVPEIAGTPAKAAGPARPPQQPLGARPQDRAGDTSQGTAFATPGSGDSRGSGSGFGVPRSPGGSRAGTGIRPAEKDTTSIRDLDLCPRCKAVQTQGGRLCTTCLYEMHTGQAGGARGRFKFTMGLGVAIAILVVAISAGVYIVATTFNTGPTVGTGGSSTAARPEATPTGEPSTSPDAATTPSPDATASGGPRSQQADPQVTWAEAAPASPTRVSRARVSSAWDPKTGRQGFALRVTAASGSTLSAGAKVVLYRATNQTGPYAQVDAAGATSLDETTNALVFNVFDGQAKSLGLNRVYYRLAGVDREGNRLFDVPPASFPVINPPKIADGKLTWAPVGATGEAPTVRCAFAIEAPGWENVVVAEVTSSGPINADVPSNSQGLPIKAVLQTAMPNEIEVTPGGEAPWRVAQVAHVLQAPSAGGAAPRGVVPVWEDGTLTYRLLPDDKAFSGVGTQPVLGPDGGVTGTTVQFALATDPAVQAIELATPPAPRNVVATPYERAVHISWDSSPLLANLDRFSGGVSVAVIRQQEAGGRTVLAKLDPSVTSYTDTTAVPGIRYSYEVAVTSAANADVPAMLRSQGWIAGHGALPMLVSAKPSAQSVTVGPEIGLTHLQVAMGPAELVYPGTCEAAINVMQAIRDAAAATPGVAILERDLLDRALDAAPSTGFGAPRPTMGFGPAAPADSAASEGLPGDPAHVQLRVLDAQTRAGVSLQLWAIDLTSGESQVLAEAPLGELQPAAFAQAASRLFAARLPSEPIESQERLDLPQQLVVAPFVPADQPKVFTGGDALSAQLTQAAAKRNVKISVLGQSGPATMLGRNPLATPGAVLIAGRAWYNANGQPTLLLQAVDATTARLLSTFREPEVTNETTQRFIEWCGTIRAMATVPSVLGASTRSALLRVEDALEPIHPVYQQMAGAADPAPPQPSNGFGMPLIAPNTVTVNVGLPLPSELQAFRPMRRRDSRDPLAPIRPYEAAQAPPTFEGYTALYARYVQADFDAFRSGLDALNAAIRSANGPVSPKFIVRGMEQPATGLVSQPINVPGDPMSLNVRGFFPMGVGGEPAVAYWRELQDQFRQRPYASYFAWKQVPPQLAEPFIKGVLLGINNGSYGRLDVAWSLPPEFDSYVAAVLLAEMGNGAGHNYRKKAIEVSNSAIKELIARAPTSLTDRQARYVTNALLILAFENEPTAISLLSDPAALNAFFRVDDIRAADALRLLVDKVGVAGWQWAQSQPTMDWPAFLWRGADEMQMVTDALPAALPAEMYAYVREMLGLPLQEAPRRPMSASSHQRMPTPRNATPAAPMPGGSLFGP